MTLATPDDLRPATPVDLDDKLARERVRGALFGELAAAVIVDRFTILQRIGSGGMSVVYAAYDPRLDRRIALKLLHAGGHDATLGSQTRQARLLREARAMAKLSHPNVAAVHDVGLVDPDGDATQVWIAMEFIDGESLAAWRHRATPSIAEILDTYAQAGRGLAAAHAAGLVHRDFKPDNAMRDAAGRVRVLDFGLARAAEDDEVDRDLAPAADEVVSRLANGSVTTTGAIVGTPAYMAPELFAGRAADAASDQFGFCAALYEAIWGERPFAGTSIAAIVAALEDGGAPNPPRRRDVPSKVRAAVLRGLSHAPAARWPTIEALLRELVVARGRATRVAVVGLAIAGVASAFAFVGLREPPCAGADARVDASWDDAARTAVHDGLATIDRHYATDVAGRVRERLDAYTDELRSAYRNSCIATRETRMQSEDLLERQVACLDRRLLEVDALVEVLRDGDVGVLDRAVQAANGLGNLRRCLDRDAVLASSTPHADAERAAAMVRVDAVLARALAASNAGRYPDARVHAEAALAAAQELDDPRLHAEAEHALGWALEQLGDAAGAYEHLANAHFLAEASGHDMLAAESASRLLSCIEISADTQGELELWRRNAQAAIDRLHDDGLSQAALDAAMGFALQQRGEIVQARVAYESALALRRQQAKGPTASLTGLQTQLAAVLGQLGEPEQAMALVDEATDTAARDLGDSHPYRGQMLINASGVHIAAGDLAGGERIAREALTVLEPSVGHDHPHIATILSNLGATLCMQERIAECADALAEAIAILERLDTKGLPWANASDNYAKALGTLGRHDDALARSRAVHDWYVAKMGVDAPRTGGHHLLLGDVFIVAGRKEEGASHHRRALEIAQAHGDAALEARARTALAAGLR